LDGHHYFLNFDLWTDSARRLADIPFLPCYNLDTYRGHSVHTTGRLLLFQFCFVSFPQMSLFHERKRDGVMPLHQELFYFFSIHIPNTAFFNCRILDVGVSRHQWSRVGHQGLGVWLQPGWSKHEGMCPPVVEQNASRERNTIQSVERRDLNLKVVPLVVDYSLSNISLDARSSLTLLISACNTRKDLNHQPRQSVTQHILSSLFQKHLSRIAQRHFNACV
jgi:hypothetical protein